LGEVNVNVEEIKVLENLGLSFIQAKAYLALIQLGRAKVGEIHNKSGIARQDIYRVLEKLHDFGLAEKIVCSPVEYIPMPLSDGLTMLVERKRTEFEEMKKNAEKINDHGFSSTSEQEVSSRHITATVGKDALNSKTIRIFGTAVQTIEYVCNWNAFIRGSIDTLDESRRAIRRGVKGRTVVELPKYPLTIPKAIQKFICKQSIELRTAESISFFFLGIVDKKEIIFTPQPQRNIATTYWSTDRGFVELANNYFESMWSKADPFDLQAIQKGPTQS
jgi:sugar-specific transcriptional regulator TrmB